MFELNEEQNAPDLSEVNFMDLLRFIFTYRRFIIIVSLLVPVSVLIWGTFFKVAQFKSSAILQVSSEDNLGSSLPNGLGSLVEDKGVANKMFALESFFQSKQFRKSLLQEVYNPSDIFDNDKNLKTEKRVVKSYLRMRLKGSSTPDSDLADSLLINREKENDALEVSAVTWSAEASQALASLASRMLVEINFNNKVSQTKAVREFLERQVENTRLQLEKLESQLTDLQLSEKSVSLSEAGSIMDKENIEMRSKQRALENQFKANEYLISEFKKERLAYLETLKGGTPSYLYMMQLQRKIELYRYQMQVNEGKRAIASESPVQNQLDSLVEDFDKEMKKNQEQLPSMSPWEYLQVLEKNISDLKLKQKTLQGEVGAGRETIKNQRQDFEKIPEKMQKLAELKRNIDITQKLYSELQTKLQETQVREAGQKNNLLMVVEPDIPKRAEGLRLLERILAAFALGVMGSFGVLVAWYFFVPTLRGKLDLNQFSLDCLGEIPRYRDSSFLPGRGRYPLVLDANPEGAEANAFKNLRFRFARILTGNNPDCGCQVASFFSVNSGEGKTFTVANLAVALSGIGQRVLLLDLDYLNPELDRYFSKLQKVDPNEDVENTLPTPFEHFKLGRNIELIRSIKTDHSFSDFLESAYFQNFMAVLKTKYDFILIDTPAIKGNFEAVVASRYSQLMVLVANHRTTFREDVWRTAQNMQEVYAGRVCAVLNCAYDEIRLRGA